MWRASSQWAAWGQSFFYKWISLHRPCSRYMETPSKVFKVLSSSVAFKYYPDEHGGAFVRWSGALSYTCLLGQHSGLFRPRSLLLLLWNLDCLRSLLLLLLTKHKGAGNYISSKWNSQKWNSLILHFTHIFKLKKTHCKQQPAASILAGEAQSESLFTTHITWWWWWWC